jgi:D-3-phosphoglycerate dehydrogenase
MKTLVVTEKPFAPVAVAQIRQIMEAEGHEVVMLECYKNVSEIIAAISDADALIVRSDIVSAEIINAAAKLRIVVRAGAGYDNLDLQACTAHNVVAMNTPGQNSNAVAELAFEMMLYNARMGFSGKTGSGTFHGRYCQGIRDEGLCI